MGLLNMENVHYNNAGVLKRDRCTTATFNKENFSKVDRATRKILEIHKKIMSCLRSKCVLIKIRIYRVTGEKYIVFYVRYSMNKWSFGKNVNFHIE